MEGHTYGAELAATWQVQETVRVYGAYTFLRMHLHEIQNSTDSSAQTEERSSPRNLVYLRGSWEPVKDVTFDLIGRYMDSIPAWNVRHYVEMDARLGWMVTRNLEAAIVGQNLLHASHFETTNSQIGNPATQVERSGYFSLTWRF
jgi:iron complex outermembrane receptor protein